MKTRHPDNLLNCAMRLVWICRSTRNTDTTCGNSAAATLDKLSSFKRRCAKLFSNGTLQLFNLHSSVLLSALRLPFPQECSPPIAAVKPPTALSEGVLVQNDWRHWVECQDGQRSVESRKAPVD